MTRTKTKRMGERVMMMVMMVLARDVKMKRKRSIRSCGVRRGMSLSLREKEGKKKGAGGGGRPKKKKKTTKKTHPKKKRKNRTGDTKTCDERRTTKDDTPSIHTDDIVDTRATAWFLFLRNKMLSLYRPHRSHCCCWRTHAGYT